MPRQRVKPQVDAVRELTERRTEKSKEFEIVGGKRRIIASTFPFHKINGAGTLEDLDNDWQQISRGVFGVKFPWFYAATTIENKIAVRVQNRSGADVTVELVEVGIGITALRIVPELDGEKIWWREVAPGLDIYLEATHAGIEFFKVLKTPLAPQRFVFRHIETDTTNLRISQESFAQDNADQPSSARRGIEIELVRTPVVGNEFQVVERVTGRSRPKPTGPTMAPWETGVLPRYPIVIDATVSDTIADTADDGEESTYLGGSWTDTITSSSQYAGIRAQGSYFSGAWRFQIPTLADGDTIDTPTHLRVGVRFRTNNCSAILRGNYVSDCGALSNTNRPNNGWTLSTNTYTWNDPGSYGDKNVPSSGTGCADIIDEIVNGASTSWAANNYIGMCLLHNSSNQFVFRDFSQSAHGSENVAQLYITYTPGAGGGGLLPFSGDRILRGGMQDREGGMR